jgi:6-phosphogluconate dehydrogenase
VVEALELGNPLTLLEEAVFGRVHAELKSSR